MKEVLRQYAEHSIFARANYTRDLPATADDAVQMIQGQIRYILHDAVISRARKMLVIEQFQNVELAQLQTKQNYTDVMEYFTGLMKQLIRQGLLAEDDPQIMAAQFCLPITVWLNLCDREPNREQEVMELVESISASFSAPIRNRQSELAASASSKYKQNTVDGKTPIQYVYSRRIRISDGCYYSIRDREESV